MVYHWGLSDSNSPQVSRTLLSIHAVLNNTVIWIVSTCQTTSRSSIPFNNPFVTVTIATISIGTIVTFMFHRFFNSLAKAKYLPFCSHSFSFILWSAGAAKSTILQNWLLLLWLLIRDFHITVTWWSFIGDWVTASLLKSPGLFSVFSIMLLSGWSPLGRQLPNLSGSLISFSYHAKSTNHNWYNCHLHVP